MSKKIVPLLLLIDGLALASAAIFAHELGIDPTAGWGRSRYAMFVGALILLSCAAYLLSPRAKETRLGVWLIESERIKIFAPLTHLWVIIILIYAWFVTFGNLTTWNHTSQYYARLADAFAKRQLYVDINPGKALLDAPDPYDPERRGVFQDEIWDMSYYKGKLYYYWGPIPALMILPLNFFLNQKITDNYLVFLFSVGILIFNSFILLKLWRRFFTSISALHVFIAITLTGLSLPILWGLSVPYVYEAAIGASQFFMIAGLYFAFGAIENNPPQNKKLFLAGLFWACAVSARAINALPVILLTLFISYWILKDSPRSARILSNLYLPLIVGAMLIAWYNWARFDFPLEFGLRYQITTFNLNEKVNLIFHSDYFFLNLYAYLLQPFALIPKFPFLQPVVFSSALHEHGIAQPGIYYAGRLTGLIVSAPFLILGLIPLRAKKGFAPAHLSAPEAGQPYRRVVALLTCSCLTSFITLLFYFTAQERFLVDTISQITLLAILGYWTMISRVQQSPSARLRISVSLAQALLIFTICASLLLAVSSETDRMQTLNPALFENINTLLGR